MGDQQPFIKEANLTSMLCMTLPAALYSYKNQSASSPKKTPWVGSFCKKLQWPHANLLMHLAKIICLDHRPDVFTGWTRYTRIHSLNTKSRSGQTGCVNKTSTSIAMNKPFARMLMHVAMSPFCCSQIVFLVMQEWAHWPCQQDRHHHCHGHQPGAGLLQEDPAAGAGEEHGDDLSASAQDADAGLSQASAEKTGQRGPRGEGLLHGSGQDSS